MKSRIVDFLLDNHLLSPLVSFSLLLLAVGTASLSLLFLSGILAYGWPFLYVYLLDVKEKSTAGTKAPAKPLTVVRPSIAAAH